MFLALISIRVLYDSRFTICDYSRFILDDSRFRSGLVSGAVLLCQESLSGGRVTLCHSLTQDSLGCFRIGNTLCTASASFCCCTARRQPHRKSRMRSSTPLPTPSSPQQISSKTKCNRHAQECRKNHQARARARINANQKPMFVEHVNDLHIPVLYFSLLI